MRLAALIASAAASDLAIDLGDGNDTLTVLASVPRVTSDSVDMRFACERRKRR